MHIAHARKGIIIKMSAESSEQPPEGTRYLAV